MCLKFEVEIDGYGYLLYRIGFVGIRYFVVIFMYVIVLFVMMIVYICWIELQFQVGCDEDMMWL